MKKHVLIIGGGASGMAAAIFGARQGAEVTILEHMDRVGKKILSTGNGKCNLTNRRMEPGCYRCSVPEFPMEVLSRFGEEDTEAFFEDLEAPKGPAEKWRVTCERGTFFSDALILAAGSKAAPATGSDGSGYKLAKKLGHRILTPLPALVQLRCREPFFKQIAGVRTDVQVKILAEGEELASDCGELQLTDYGISGIPVFQVSRFAARALYEKKQVTAVIDFCPDMGKKETGRFLRERRELLAERSGEGFFNGWLNKKLALLFLRMAGIRPERQTESFTERELSALARLLKEFETEVVSTNPFENAQVCCGGVDVRDINPYTMESKIKKGLYLTGELLDVDGICGGYNLQWAWSTGAVAGIHAGTMG